MKKTVGSLGVVLCVMGVLSFSSVAQADSAVALSGQDKALINKQIDLQQKTLDQLKKQNETLNQILKELKKDHASKDSSALERA